MVISKKIIDIFIPIIIFLALIGLADSVYLTTAHYSGSEVFCNILNECDIVTTSPYSEIFDIPVALFGSIFYLTVFVSALFFSFKRKKGVLKFIIAISPLGFLASLWFVYLQLFVINAICFYCMVSALTSTLIFLVAMLMMCIRKSS